MTIGCRTESRINNWQDVPSYWNHVRFRTCNFGQWKTARGVQRMVGTCLEQEGKKEKKEKKQNTVLGILVYLVYLVPAWGGAVADSARPASRLCHQVSTYRSTPTTYYSVRYPRVLTLGTLCTEGLPFRLPASFTTSNVIPSRIGHPPFSCEKLKSVQRHAHILLEWDGAWISPTWPWHTPWHPFCWRHTPSLET